MGSRIPLYMQLMDTLLQKIDDQTYKEHEKLPSERELCEIYGMSRITVRQALQQLTLEGYIYKLQGKGTFVAPKSYNQVLSQLYSFTEEMKKIGKVPSTKVLSFETIVADERLASKMEINNHEEVFKIVRLRLADDEVLMYETSYLPKKHFRHLTEEDLKDRPMYNIFNEDYKIVLTKAIERFSATSIRNLEAKYFKVNENQPGMLIKRYAYHHMDVIEYTISVARGDRFNYTVELM